VNYAVRENYIVLDKVPASIILRSGKDSAILVRGTPVAAAAPPPPAKAEPEAAPPQPLAANSPHN
jgi:hypothetical protein